MDKYDSWKLACCDKYPNCDDCDNEKEPEAVCECSYCGSDIYPGDLYLPLVGECMCSDCVYENMVEARG